MVAVPGLASRPGDSRRLRVRNDLLEGIRDSWRVLLHPTWRLLGGFGYLLFDIAVLWAMLRALGETPPVAALVLGYTIGYLANAVPIPGGFGVLDGGLAAMLLVYGAPAGHVAAAVLVYHAIALWLPGLGGLVAYARLRRRLAVGGDGWAGARVAGGGLSGRPRSISVDRHADRHRVSPATPPPAHRRTRYAPPTAPSTPRPPGSSAVEGTTATVSAPASW